MLICFLQTLAPQLADVEALIDTDREYTVYTADSQLLAAVLLPRPTTRIAYTVPAGRVVMVFVDAASPVGSEVFATGQDAYDYYEGLASTNGLSAWTVCR